jgi:hypothetical protein
MFKSFIFSAFALFSTQFLVAQIPTVSSADLRNAALESTPGPKLSRLENQDTLRTVQEVLKHQGEDVVIEGLVRGTHVSKKGNYSIYLFAAYPNHSFSLIIKVEEQSKFKPLASYEGKKVRVTGFLSLPSEQYPKPAIFLKTSDQIQIIE